MKKLLWLTIVSILLLVFAGTLFAQETAADEGEAPAPEASARETSPNNEFQIHKNYPWSLGASFQAGANTREDAATGFGIGLDRYIVRQYLALGLRGNMHNDAKSITATEALLNVRGYIPIANNAAVSASLFAQLGFGAAFYREEDRQKNTYAMDFTAGSRVYFTRGLLRGFYLEPFIRTGFPFLFSGGIAVGHWFNF